MKHLSFSKTTAAAIIGMASFATLLVQCAPGLYAPATDQAAWASEKFTTAVTVQDLEDGKTLYPLYCATCHELQMPGQYTLAEWQNIYPIMAEKVSLADSSEQKIMYYLYAGARDAGK